MPAVGDQRDWLRPAGRVTAIRTSPEPVSQSASSPPPSSAQGAVVKGAAGGAIIGGIAGDAGKGAAVGALFGGFRKASASNERAKWEQQQAAQRQQHSQQLRGQYQQGLNTFNRALAVCMEGRGYTVK